MTHAGEIATALGNQGVQGFPFSVSVWMVAAQEWFRRVYTGPQGAAFGFIVAEAELTRLGSGNCTALGRRNHAILCAAHGR